MQNTSSPERVWKLQCWKSARRCGAKHISTSKCKKRLRFGARLEIEMLKKRSVVARSAFPSQHVQNDSSSERLRGWHTYTATHPRWKKAGGAGWNAHVHCKPRMAHIQWHTCTLNRGCGGVDVYVFTFTGTCKTKHGTYTVYTLNKYTLNRGWGDGGVYFGSSKTAANRCNLLRVTVHEPPIQDRCGLHKNNKKTQRRLVFLHQDPYLELQANHRPPVVIWMVVLAGFDTVRFPALLIKYHPRKRRLEVGRVILGMTVSCIGGVATWGSLGIRV